MTLNKSLYYILTVLVLVSMVFGTTGCKEEAIVGCMDASAENYDPDATEESGLCDYAGCTDPAAENFDPAATISNDMCVYPRDKYIGIFVGTIECQIITVIDNPDFSLEISESLLGGIDEVDILLSTLGLTVAGTIVDNKLFINSSIPNFPFPSPLGDGSTIEADLEVSGEGSLDDLGNTMSGFLNISAQTALLPTPITDICDIVALRQ